MPTIHIAGDSTAAEKMKTSVRDRLGEKSLLIFTRDPDQ